MAVSTIGTMDSGFALLLVVLCLVMLSVSMLRRSQQRSATARDLTREQLARLRDQKDVRHSMDELLVQLEEVSRRINAQVDTRFAKLEAVIRDADDRIARLEQLAPGTPRGSAPATLPGAAGDAEAWATGSEGFQPGSAGVSTPGTPMSEPSKTSPTPHPGSQDERRQRVYELADAGTAPITIADILRVPLGEVELILSLRDFK